MGKPASYITMTVEQGKSLISLWARQQVVTVVELNKPYLSIIWVHYFTCLDFRNALRIEVQLVLKNE